MLNQYIVDYLKRNKDKFSLEVLREKLLKAGYPENQIEEAGQLVYRIAPPSAPKKISKVSTFWDFWHKKTYISRSEKVLDFIAGFIFVIVLGYIFRFVLSVIHSQTYGFSYYILSFILDFIVFLGLIIYFLIKRKYIAFGMICMVLFSFLLSAFILSRFLL